MLNDNTERKRMEEELLKSEAAFSALANHIPQMVWICGSDGLNIYFNQQWVDYTGMTLEESYGQGWNTPFHPDDKQAAWDAWSCAVQKGEKYQVESRLRASDGSYRWFLMRGEPMRQATGKATRWFGTCTDIEDLKQTENALRQSEERFRNVVESAPVGIYIQTDGRIRYLNPAAISMLGALSADQILGQAFLERIHPDYRSTVIGRDHRVMQERLAVPFLEEKLLRIDGIAFDAEVSAIPFSFEGRDGSIVFVRDITERKQSENALRESDERFRIMADGCPAIIWVTDADGRNQFVNEAYREFGGAIDVPWEGSKWHLLLHPEDQSWYVEAFQRAVAEQATFRAEARVRRKDGEWRWLASYAEPRLSSTGEFLGHVGLSLDVTERKQSEAEKAKLIQSIEQVGESIIITDTEGAIQYVNPAFEKVSGYTRSEVIGSNPRILKSGLHPDSFYQEMWATLLRGETWAGDLTNKSKDGTLHHKQTTISPIKGPNGTTISFVSVGRDVTNELSLRDQLNRAQKLESVGRLAGGIAHDFNNLLMAIRTYTELLQSQFSLDSGLRRYTEQVLAAVERGSNLTGQMLAFSRKQVISPVTIDLNAVIDESAKMLRRLIGEHIDFRVAPAESLWAVKADPDQIFQVLMNLCINSRDAMPHGGTITVSTENVKVTQEKLVAGRPYVSPGDYVKLSVADTGSGISQEIIEKIFDPFFTTKDVGKGTGLGLATVYGLVKSSGGYVWADSELGHGTCLTIYLPTVDRAVEVRPVAKATAMPIGTETVMVVEDEDLLRRGICEFLRGLGYKVLVASNGPEALTVAMEHPHIDLLLTDIVMPKMSGTELSQVLRSLRPDLKVILMSGYAEDDLSRSGVQQPYTSLLQKPFGLSTLAQRVREAIDKVGGAAI